MQSLENHIFIQGLRNSDTGIFEKVYLKFNKNLFGMAYRYLRSTQLAEDAVQEVFIKLWTDRLNLDDEKSLQGFLFSALKNHVLNMIRSNDRRILRNYEYTHITINGSDDPEMVLVEGDYNRLLEKGLENLPLTKKKVFLLKKKGLSYEEISTNMGLSINTVKAHLYQARKFLQNYIDRQDGPHHIYLVFIGYQLLIHL